MKQKTIIILLCLGLMSTGLWAQKKQGAGKLKIGVAAPALNGLEWIKGDPVSLKKGTIYVLEFWATWCGPCRTSIPHLTKMQEKYKDKNVKIIGVSTDKSSEVNKVKKFVKNMAGKMNYTVAFDAKGSANKGYMKAFGARGIPHAFIIDKQGKIVWQGHPMDNMDSVLEKVISGSFDYQNYAKKKAVENEKQMKMILIYNSYFKALKENGKIKARKIGVGLLKDAPLKMLNSFAWTILTKVGKEERDLGLALRIAAKGVIVTESKDPAVMDTYALALFESGQVDEAVRYQKKAMAIAAKDKASRASYQKTLDKFLAAPRKEGDTVIGQKAPAWNVNTWTNLPTAKTTLNPGDLQGKVVYLTFFQSSCSASKRRALPVLKGVFTSYKGNDKVSFVSVQTVLEDAEFNTLGAGITIMQGRKIKAPMGHVSGDSAASVIKSYKAAGTPWSVIIDRQGVVRFSDSKIEPEQAQLIIDELLAENVGK